MSRHSAYTELLERHRRMVWALCWKSARGNRSRCKDLLQEVSITLWIHFDELRPDAVLQEEKAWVRWWTRSVLDLQRRKERPSLLPLTSPSAFMPKMAVSSSTVPTARSSASMTSQAAAS